MLITLVRKYFKPTYTIGDLYIDGVWFCNVIEDVDRGLYDFMPIEEIQRLKIYGETAIPYGYYKVIITYSPKFKRNLPLLVGVKGFDGIRIHAGNTEKDSLGCLCLGENKVKGKVINSQKTLNKLMDILSKVGNKEGIEIEIKQ